MTSGDVVIAGTISTSGITGAGLKKCMPMTRSACAHAAASAAMDSDEVFVASTHSRGTISSSAAKSSRLALELLDDRLDHEVAGRVGAQSAGQPSASEMRAIRRVRRVLREPSLRDFARQRAAHVRRAPLDRAGFASPSTT